MAQEKTDLLQIEIQKNDGRIKALLNVKDKITNVLESNYNVWAPRIKEALEHEIESLTYAIELLQKQKAFLEAIQNDDFEQIQKDFDYFMQLISM